MSTIHDFGDLAGLYCVWNTEESEINTTGSTVDSIVAVPGQGSNDSATMVAKTGGDVMELLGTIGAMSAISSPDIANSDAGMQYQFSPSLPSNAFTLVWTEQRYEESSGNYSINMRRGGSGNHTYFDRSSTSLRATTQNGTLNPAVLATHTDYATYAIAAGTGTNNSTIYWSINGGAIQSAALEHTSDYLPVEIGWFNQYQDGAGNNMRGKGSILAIYTTKLSLADVTSAIDLANYWMANGEKPAAGAPTSGSFNTVTTNDDPNIQQWQWQESVNNVDWSNIGTVLTDTEGEQTPTLTVKSAPLSANGLYVRCTALSNQGAYAESQVGRLWVQAP